jgi:hypothetical protein
MLDSDIPSNWQRLLQLKKVPVNNHALPYHMTNCLEALRPNKFDAILVIFLLQGLAVPNLAADPSFMFLCVGSGAGEGLERG